MFGVLVVPVVAVVQTSAIVISHSEGHTDIIIFSLPCYCLQVSTWETFTKNPLRENQHKSPGFWLQQYRYLEWYLNVYTWVKSNQECIWTLDRIPRTGHLHIYTLTMTITFLHCKKLCQILHCRKLCKICSVEMYVLKVSYSRAANGRFGLFVLWFEYLPSWCPLMMRIPWHSVIVRNLKHEEVQITNIGWKLYLKNFLSFDPNAAPVL